MTTSDIMKNICVYINGKLAGRRGLYMEWLSIYVKNLEDILCPHSYLLVHDWEDGSTTFELRADDCTQAEFKWKNGKLWLICPFLDDDEQGELTIQEFDERLREFAARHGVQNVITSDKADMTKGVWLMF